MKGNPHEQILPGVKETLRELLAVLDASAECVSQQSAIIAGLRQEHASAKANVDDLLAGRGFDPQTPHTEVAALLNEAQAVMASIAAKINAAESSVNQALAAARSAAMNAGELLDTANRQARAAAHQHLDGLLAPLFEPSVFQDSSALKDERTALLHKTTLWSRCERREYAVEALQRFSRTLSPSITVQNFATTLRDVLEGETSAEAAAGVQETGKRSRVTTTQEE